MIARAILLSVCDLAVLAFKVDLAVGLLRLVRWAWRWTRVPLGEREGLLWMKFMYEVVSGYGEGETRHIFEAAGHPYPNWGSTSRHPAGGGPAAFRRTGRDQ